MMRGWATHARAHHKLAVLDDTTAGNDREAQLGVHPNGVRMVHTVAIDKEAARDVESGRDETYCACHDSAVVAKGAVAHVCMAFGDVQHPTEAVTVVNLARDMVVTEAASREA